MKNLRLVIMVGLLAVVVLIAALGRNTPAPGSACGPYRSDRVVSIGTAKVKAEVADSIAEREKGLSGRPCIEPDRGMLFVFDKPGQYPFWMKDMRFAIDIVWIGSNHKVAGYDFNVHPSTYPDSFVSEKPVQYVLELQANRAKDLKVNRGTRVNF